MLTSNKRGLCDDGGGDGGYPLFLFSFHYYYVESCFRYAALLCACVCLKKNNFFLPKLLHQISLSLSHLHLLLKRRGGGIFFLSNRCLRKEVLHQKVDCLQTMCFMNNRVSFRIIEGW